MDVVKQIEKAPDWCDQTWAQRLDMAASVLFIHGYITQSQRTKIANKMNAQFEKAIADGAIVERKAESHA